MAFLFRLRAVLRYRKGMERQQELLLEQANLRAAKLKQEIDSLDHSLQALAAQQVQELEEGSTAAHLHHNQFLRDTMLTRRPMLERDLAQAEQVRHLRSDAFLKARRQREVVETLGKQERRAYELQEGREQQRLLDDLFLMRSIFLKHD